MTRTMFAHSRQEPLSILVVLAVGQNNFSNKIPFFAIQSQQSIIVLGKRVACTQSGPRKIEQSISQQSVISNFALVIIQIVGPVHEKGQFMFIASVCIELNMFHYTNVQKNVWPNQNILQRYCVFQIYIIPSPQHVPKLDFQMTI